MGIRLKRKVMPINNEPIKDDLTDSPSDIERLKSDKAIFDLPEVSDIPGQENYIVPEPDTAADTTFSSDDEEDIISSEDGL